MFLFYHLLLAHVTADFAFQPKELFTWKKKSFWGIAVHSLIFLIIAGIFCFTYLSNMLFIGLLALITLARMVMEDLRTRITDNTRFDNIATFLTDQSIKVSMLLIFALAPQFGRAYYIADSFLAKLYNNDLLIQYLSLFIIAIYGGSFFVFYLKKTFIDPGHRFKYDRLGMIERLIVFTSILLGGAWVLTIPLIVLLKGLLVFSGIRGSLVKVSEPAFQFQKIKLKSFISFDMLASPLFAVLIGIIAKGL